MPENLYALPTGCAVRGLQIERIIACGTHHIVYLATDARLGREVALKEWFPRDLATRGEDCTRVISRRDDQTELFSRGLCRFLAESSAAARWQHPTIPAVYDLFEENGTAYQVAQLLRGESLECYLRRHDPTREAELLTLALDLLKGLKFIHANGCLHLDVSLGNIAVEPRRGRNQPVFLGFLPAQISPEKETRTLTSALTSGYAPFEQYMTNGNRGPWTDLYALGAVLFHAVTGTPPEAAIVRIDTDHVPTLAKQSPSGYSRAFLATIDKALRMRREERWQNCQEWIDALQHPAPAVPVRPSWFRRLLTA